VRSASRLPLVCPIIRVHEIYTWNWTTVSLYCINCKWQWVYKLELTSNKIFAAGGMRLPSGNLIFSKITLIGCRSGIEPRNVKNALAERRCEWDGGITSAEGLMTDGSELCPFLNSFQTIPWHLPYNSRKSRQTSPGQSINVRHQSLCRLACPCKRSPDCPAGHQSSSVNPGWIQSALGRHKRLPICRTRGFTKSAKLESKLSVNTLMWSVKNAVLRS
jgi:hypothetical protein